MKLILKTDHSRVDQRCEWAGDGFVEFVAKRDAVGALVSAAAVPRLVGASQHGPQTRDAGHVLGFDRSSPTGRLSAGGARRGAAVLADRAAIAAAVEEAGIDARHVLAEEQALGLRY